LQFLRLQNRYVFTISSIPRQRSRTRLSQNCAKLPVLVGPTPVVPNLPPGSADKALESRLQVCPLVAFSG